MSDTVLLFVGGIVGAILTMLGPLLVARFSKTRQEKDAGLAKEYLTLADMSADQLERRINLIGTLDERLSKQEKKMRALEAENEELERLRTERDERIESLEAHTAALNKQIQKDTEETQKLRGEVEKLRQQVAEGEKKYKILKDYTLQLLTDWKEGKPIPDMPPELGDSITGWKYPK